MYTADRMRKDLYHRWAHAPLAYQPGTRMPKFADPDNRTSLRDIEDGDATRLFEAIWQYLRAGENIESP